MPDILLELFSEEMPADIQISASENLKNLITDGFAGSEIFYSSATNFSTPQRLCVVIEGLSTQSKENIELKRGPKIDAPKRAVEGFAQSLGLTVDALTVEDDKKGKYYFATLSQPAVDTRDIASKIIETAILKLAWPKSMRWGSSRLRWVRPLKAILCILIDKNESEIVPVKIHNIIASNMTSGHRFMSPAKFVVNSFDEYEGNLRKNFVILNPKERLEIIWADANNLAFSQGLEIIKDENLLAEVVGLVEWPVVLMGNVARDYLDLPAEVLQTSMRKHQKFFSVMNAKTQKIEKFITVANVDTTDNGAMIIKGNQKVLDARLADGQFFFENDLRIAKEGGNVWIENLRKVIFHSKLGSQADRIQRINDLAIKLAPYFNLKEDQVIKAVGFAKADLCSQMVNEFPELQGVMGKYYAEEFGYDQEISLAVLEHYQPLGPSDAVPSSSLSIVIALADKLDLISSFWAINEKPTGSKDPFALRRAAIGIIRLILSSDLKFNLLELLDTEVVGKTIPMDEIIYFLHERLKFYLRSEGIRYDAIDACVEMPDSDDLVVLVKRITALDSFLQTKNGINLLSGFKRANNILIAEEKKDGVKYELDPELKFLKDPNEKKLYSALNDAKLKIKIDLKEENFTEAMSAMADLREPIDRFFKEVKVNDENQIIRRNRLCLLNNIKNVCCSVSNLNCIQESTK